jgi:hypothetical protein
MRCTNTIARSIASAVAILAALASLLSFAGVASAQPARAPAATAREAATLDPTGYWVAVVTEDWKYRMAEPPKGVYDGIPLNAEGRRVADAWDQARETAAGEQCRAYGAANVMRVPGRLRIAWDDADTLRIDTDAGAQTRLLEFAPVHRAPAPSWQGLSLAEWQRPAAQSAPGSGGTLKVETTQMRPGYLRSNGVPYSEGAVLTEYYNRISAPNGDAWLVVTQVIEDPAYLSRPYVTSAHFKKLADDAGWNPTPC